MTYCCTAFRIPTNSPVSHSHVWNHRRFLQCASQGLTQFRALWCFYGLELAGQRCFQLITLQTCKDLLMADGHWGEDLDGFFHDAVTDLAASLTTMAIMVFRRRSRRPSPSQFRS